jgi:hypothetical protein
MVGPLKIWELLSGSGREGGNRNNIKPFIQKQFK